MKENTKLDEKINEIMSRNMKLDFVPQYKVNLREIAEFVFEEVLMLEQTGLREVNDWGISVKDIKALKNLFTYNKKKSLTP